MKQIRRNQSGFTLIELVMTTLILSILAAIAIPQFIDFRTDAKNATTKAALGAMRAAIANARATVALKEPSLRPAPAAYWVSNEGYQMYWRWNYTRDYPTVDMLNANVLGGLQYFQGNCGGGAQCDLYPSCSGIAIMDGANGIPENPWSLPSYASVEKRYVFDGTGQAAGALHTAVMPVYDGYGVNTPVWSNNKGWAYNPYTGTIWANTANNASSTLTENLY